MYLSILAFLSRWFQRIIGVVLFIGALLAIGGWLMVALHPHPQDATWTPSVLAVIIGSLAVVVGLWLLYMRNFIQAGLLGRVGVSILFIGALIMVVGSIAVDLVFIPGIYRMTAIPNILDPVQKSLNASIQGINSSLSSVTSGLNTVGSGLGKASSIFSPGSSGFSISTPSVPGVNVPAIDGTFLVGSFLSAAGLPALSNLGAWGLAFLSGAPLALGCLLLGLALLRAEVANSSALSFLITCAILNLISVLLLRIPFFVTLSSLLIFPAIAWLGFSICSPWQPDVHLPASVQSFFKRSTQRLPLPWSAQKASDPVETPIASETPGTVETPIASETSVATND